MADIVLGFSGGVDSSVAAALLARRGFRVRAVFLDTGSGEAAAAARAAAAMGLDFQCLDARAALEEAVCRPFAAAYRRGETPNPCVLCNPAVKLRLLCEAADRLGAAQIATGHYARAEGGALYRGLPANDQSYMLCRILPAQLARLVLPLGGYEKARVRALARELGLPAADRPDSMEICFIPDGDYAAWIERRGEAPPPGDLIYGGRAVGRHGGVHRYTLGQRRGLGFAAGRRVYVAALRPETGEVVLADGAGLFVRALEAADMRWLAPPREGPFPCLVRVRHARGLAPATACAGPGGALRVDFEAPVRAPAPGQYAALYDGERLLGGARITAGA